MTSTFSPSRAVMIWLWTGIFLILIMVSIGGLTRLTHSGLSMVHWTFTGSLPPLNEAQWIAEFDRYQTSPEYIELHNHFSLSDFKSIFWWEYIHRMFGRLIGLIFIIPFAYFLLNRKIPKQLLPQFFIILGLGAFQALLGWFMVKSGLVDVPRVSHYRLAAHLITAFLTCAYIFWVLQNFHGYGKLEHYKHRFSNALMVLTLIIIAQIIIGGFVAGLRAGWVHNTWPLMDGSVVAESVFALDPVWLNFVEGKSGVQFIHRTLGIVIFLFTLIVSYKTWKTETDWLKGPALLLSAMVFMQFLLGVFTLILSVPTALAVAHQVMALITLLTSIWFYHRTKFICEG